MGSINNLKNLIKELIKESYSSGLGKVADQDIENLKKLKTIDEIFKYFNNNILKYEFKGGGASRFVFFNRNDDSYVIKIAYTDIARGNNIKEATSDFRKILKNYTAKIYDYDPDGKWLVMDRCELLKNPSDIEGWIDSILGNRTYRNIDEFIKYDYMFIGEEIRNMHIWTKLYRERPLPIIIMCYLAEMTVGADKKDFTIINDYPTIPYNFYHNIYEKFIKSGNEFLNNCLELYQMGYMNVIIDLRSVNLGYDHMGEPVVLDFGDYLGA